MDFTLRQAVKNQVILFNENLQSFSVYDITTAIREHVNNEDYEISEVETDSNFSWRYEIEHAEVKRYFDDLFTHELLNLNRTFNGKYWVYSSDTYVKTVQALFQYDLASLERRIEQYLENCVKRGFQPTYAHVQRAIKRGKQSTGMKVAEIKAAVQRMRLDGAVKQ